MNGFDGNASAVPPTRTTRRLRRLAGLAALCLLAGLAFVPQAAASHIAGGLYTGTHSANGPMSFQVSPDGSLITRLRFERLRCLQGGTITTETTFGTGIPISQTGAHAFTWQSSEDSFSGSFAPPATAQGTFRVQQSPSVPFACTTPVVNWTATTPDTAPPDTTITSGPTAITGDNTPTFSFASDEPGSTFECRVGNAAFSPCSSPHTTAALADGQHTFDVRARDASNNLDPTPASRSFRVDTVPPDTTIDSGPTGPTNDSTPTFGVSSSEAGATLQCRVDNGAFSPCSSPYTTPVLSDGPHTVAAQAVDAAGNVDPTPATRSFAVDTIAPQTTIQGGPSGSTTDTTPTFEFSASESATFECRVDAGAFASCTSPHTTAALAIGPHTFEVRATDPVGNVDATPERREFTVSPPPRDGTTTPGGTSAGGPPPGSAGSLPIAFAGSSRLVVGSDRRFSVALQCPAQRADRCGGTLALRSLGAAGARSAARKLSLRNQAAFDIAPGKSARIKFRLTRKQVARLRSGGPIRLQLTITPAAGPAVTRTVTLRAGGRR